MSEEEEEEEEKEEEGDEVGEDDVETEADLLEGDIAVAEVTYRQPCNNFLKLFWAYCWHCSFQHCPQPWRDLKIVPGSMEVLGHDCRSWNGH